MLTALTIKKPEKVIVPANKIIKPTLGFLYTKIQELETENAKLRAEFKEVLTALTIKKPVGEEIAELQERIMKLYSGKN